MHARRRRLWRIGAAVLIVSLSVGAQAATAGRSRVKASNFDFKPGTIRIQKGQKVTWKLLEGRHTVTLKNGSFDKVLSNAHPRRSLRFTKRGTVRYYCRFHRSLGMKGKVVVR